MRRILSFLAALPAVACIAVLAALFVGPAIAVEVAGATAPGTVVAKREEITPKSEGWQRQLFVEVRYRPAEALNDEAVQISIDAAGFDRLQVGAPVGVRYLTGDETLRMVGNAGGARLETQAPFGPLAARYGVLAPILIGVALWLLMLWAWSRWKRWYFAVGVLAVMIGGAFLSGSGWQPPLPPGEQIAASAIVREATRIDEVWGGRRTSAEPAVQPFLVVELEFVPAGQVDPVVAVDLVDEGSVPGFELGGDVAIRYSAADPRRAQIDGATRTYVWKNLRSFGIIALLMLGLVGGLYAYSRWRRSGSRGGGAQGGTGPTP